MLRLSDPGMSSTLELVASDMTDIMERLDTRELDLGDGEFDAMDAGWKYGRDDLLWKKSVSLRCIFKIVFVVVCS